MAPARPCVLHPALPCDAYYCFIVVDGARDLNCVLEQSSSTKRVKNFGSDLRDGEALSVLLTQLDPTNCDFCHEAPGSEARARHIIRNAKVGVLDERGGDGGGGRCR